MQKAKEMEQQKYRGRSVFLYDDPDDPTAVTKPRKSLTNDMWAKERILDLFPDAKTRKSVSGLSEAGRMADVFEKGNLAKAEKRYKFI